MPRLLYLQDPSSSNLQLKILYVYLCSHNLSHSRELYPNNHYNAFWRPRRWVAQWPGRQPITAVIEKVSLSAKQILIVPVPAGSARAKFGRARGISEVSRWPARSTSATKVWGTPNYTDLYSLASPINIAFNMISLSPDLNKTPQRPLSTPRKKKGITITRPSIHLLSKVH